MLFSCVRYARHFGNHIFVCHTQSEDLRRQAMKKVGIDPQGLESCDSVWKLEQHFLPGSNFVSQVLPMLHMSHRFSH